MKNIQLNNGKTVLIHSNKDFLEIIEENLSYELAEHIESIISGLNDDVEELNWYYKECQELNDKNEKLEDTLDALEMKNNCLKEEVQELKKQVEKLSGINRISMEKYIAKIQEESEDFLPFC